MAEDKPADFDFFIEGKPAPGGSKTFFPCWRADGTCVTVWKTGKGPDANAREWPVIRVTDDAGEGNKEWRRVVASIAKHSLPTFWKPTVRPVMLRFNFWLYRAQNEYRTNGDLKPSAQKYHLQKPDVLKLARSTEDALTGIVWHDDCQVVSQTLTKEFVAPGKRMGARIRIYLLGEGSPHPEDGQLKLATDGL